MLTRKYLFFLLIISCLTTTSFLVQAVSVVRDPVEVLNNLENEVIGVAETNGLVERLNKLEQLLVARNYEETITERLTRLERIVYTNRPYDISLIYKVQALEWVLFHEGMPGSVVSRVEKIEKLLFGKIYGGSLNKRLEMLITQVFPEGVRGQWTDIPEGTLVKVRVKDQLSSIDNQIGTRFRFEIVETIINNGFVLFMKGISSNGFIRQVRKPAIFGKDAQLLLDFTKTRAMDGTEVELSYGTKASEINHSFKWAVGASAAGMLALGPGGILTGILIRGRQVTIPAGTEFYLQIKNPIRIYTIKEQ